MLLLYAIPTILRIVCAFLTPRDVMFSGDAMFTSFWLMRDTVVPRLRDTRDLIRGCIFSGACGI